MIATGASSLLFYEGFNQSLQEPSFMVIYGKITIL